MGRGLLMATCESLTGGLVYATATEVPGASAVVRGSLVTYATDTKASLAGVDGELLAARGPVDPMVAEQMARGAARALGADIGVALTGVAGPSSQDGHPVGEVWVGIALAPRIRQLPQRGEIGTVNQDASHGCAWMSAAARVVDSTGGGVELIPEGIEDARLLHGSRAEIRWQAVRGAFLAVDACLDAVGVHD